MIDIKLNLTINHKYILLPTGIIFALMILEGRTFCHHDFSRHMQAKTDQFLHTKIDYFNSVLYMLRVLFSILDLSL